MAVPHVAGAAALYLERHPAAAPAEVKAALLGGATRGVLELGGARGTPNAMLYTGAHESGGGAAAAAAYGR